MRGKANTGLICATNRPSHKTNNEIRPDSTALREPNYLIYLDLRT